MSLLMPITKTPITINQLLSSSPMSRPISGRSNKTPMMVTTHAVIFAIFTSFLFKHIWERVFKYLFIGLFMQIIKAPGINGLGKTEGCRNAGNAIIKKLDEIYTSERGKPIDRKLLDLEEIHVDNG